MSEEKREGPRKAPIGTIRYWQGGLLPVIKAFDNSIADSGWINLPALPHGLTQDLRELDELGKQISQYHDPIDGNLWTSKCITEFKTSSGEVYKPSDFKQYSGWYGNIGYSFTSEFSKRYCSGKIRLASDINDAILDANKAKGQREGKAFDTLILTKEEVKSIRERIKSNFKDNYIFDTNDIVELKKLLKKVNKYLTQGEDFEDEEQKRVYQENKSKLSTFLDEYQPIKIKRQLKDQMLEEIDNTFQDNWGIRESFRKKVEDVFSRYVSKYLERIKKEEVIEFEKTIKCPINAPTEQFYTALNNSPLCDIHIDLNSFIGKKVPSNYGKYNEVTLKSFNEETGEVKVLDSQGREENYSFSNNSVNDLYSKLKSREGTDLSIIFQLRFKELYQKDLEGSWDTDSITPLHTFEKVIHYLPPGHCLTNRYFKNLKKDDNYSDTDGYAHYTSGRNTIFLSSKALAETDRYFTTSLNDGNQFVSVLIHEIGHAVSDKFKRAFKTKYRDFSRECGWSWDYLDKEDINTFHATGTDPDIKRTGVNANANLITKYAQKSPEEAFAEYYSFYSQYKKEINQLLDHNKTELLGFDREKLINPSFGKTKSVSEIINININPKLRENIDSSLFSQCRNIEDNIKLDFVSPWDLKHKQIHNENIDKKRLRNYIDFTKEKDHRPLVCIQKLNGSRELIGEEDEGYLNLANRVAKKPTPVCSISEEVYNNLKSQSYSDKDIIDYAFFNIKDQKYPLNENTNWETKHVEGLKYGTNIVPKEILIKNKEIFKKMRSIYYSEELLKALQQEQI